MGGPEFEELQGHVLVMYKALMVQDQEGHVGMTNSLIYSMTWVSNPQKQIQTMDEILKGCQSL